MIIPGRTYVLPFSVSLNNRTARDCNAVYIFVFLWDVEDAVPTILISDIWFLISDRRNAG